MIMLRLFFVKSKLNLRDVFCFKRLFEILPPKERIYKKLSFVLKLLINYHNYLWFSSYSIISTVPGIILWDVIHHRGSVRYGPVAKFIWQGSCFTFYVSLFLFIFIYFYLEKKLYFGIKLFLFYI